MTLEQPLGLRSARDGIFPVKAPVWPLRLGKMSGKPAGFTRALVAHPSAGDAALPGCSIPEPRSPRSGRGAERGSRMPSRGKSGARPRSRSPRGRGQTPGSVFPLPRAAAGTPSPPEHPRPARAAALPPGITETFPGHSVRHLLLRRGESSASCPPAGAAMGAPLLPAPIPRGSRIPPARGGELRRGAGRRGRRAAGGGRGAAGGLWGSCCTGRCRSSGCGPPAAPAAGSGGRWHSRWSAGCPGPLQSKHRAGCQGMGRVEGML